MTAHVCKPDMTCRCVPVGDSPDPDCPIHGDGPDYGRCGTCGRFLKRPASAEPDDNYTDWDANRAKSYTPPRRRPMPDDYEPQWDPRERD